MTTLNTNRTSALGLDTFIFDLINRTASVNYNEDADTMSALIRAADDEIIERFGAHPTEEADPGEFNKRRYAMARFIDGLLQDDVGLQQRALYTIGYWWRDDGGDAATD